MKNRLLFIGSLPTKKVHFNGETNKSGDILKFFKKIGTFKISKVNLTSHKLLATFKMICDVMLFKYNVIFVSKCVSGGSLAIRLISKFAKKFNKNNVYFYWIGNGTFGLDESSIHLDDLKICKRILVESKLIAEEFSYLGKDKFIICPCIKPNYELEVRTKNYKEKDYGPIRCIFFSRITKEKGALDAVKAVEEVNKRLGRKVFTLDLAGSPGLASNDPFEAELLDYIKGKDEFVYYGKSFCVTGLETYIRLQNYDLHLFPSYFKQECVPGSIVDMFIAGVPTVSSLFPNAKNLLSEKDSYFFEQGNLDSFIETLVYISEHLDELNEKRISSFKLQYEYNEDKFKDIMTEMGVLK